MGDGSFCNIEVQKSDNDDHVRRVRYNASCITSNNTEVGEKFIHVPNVTMVYISAFDMFKKGKTIYHCKTIVQETGQVVENGLTEVYVNTVINDGSTIAELMECFMQEQVENKKFPLLSGRVWYYKNEERGVRTMCKIMEDYAKEKVDEASLNTAKKFFQNGCSLEIVLASIENIPEEILRKLYEEVMSTKSV